MKTIILKVITASVIMFMSLYQSGIEIEVFNTELDTMKISSSYLNQVQAPKEEVVINQTSPVVNVPRDHNFHDTDVIKVWNGTMSAYGPDCLGCSGITASGRNVRYGNILYYDPVFGTVRILAADRSLPFGTIVRVNGTHAGDFIGIVLDRGGGIGIGRSHLFDLLFTSNEEARLFGVARNVDFEILRLGR